MFPAVRWLNSKILLLLLGRASRQDGMQAGMVAGRVGLGCVSLVSVLRIPGSLPRAPPCWPTKPGCAVVYFFFFFFFSWGPRRTDYVLFLTCFFFVGDGSLSRFLFETKIVVLQHVFNCPCVSSRILGTKCRTTCRFRFRFTARTVNNSLSTTGPCHHAANFVVSMFHGRGPPRAPQPVPNDWDPRT